MKITEFKDHYKKYYPVGMGWKLLLDRLVENIIQIDPKVEITQIKEKFGGLRFYIDGGNDPIYKLIHDAEHKSFKICERCGTQKNVKTEGSWLKTLCKTCRTEK